MRIGTLYINIRKTVALLTGLLALSVFLYGALLLGAVAHATGRTAAEERLDHLQAAIGALESEYFAKTRALTPERAAEMGFVASEAVATVYAGASSLTVR